jgi:hypothetical protein
MKMSEIQAGETLLLKPILKLKKPESFRGWGSFKIVAESLSDLGVIDTNGEEFLFTDYVIKRG